MIGIPNTAILAVVPPVQIMRACEVGIARANYAFDHALPNYGEAMTQSQQMAHHIRAARTERAVENYTGLPWHEAIGVLGGPDVGDNIQVRSRPYPPGGDLAFRPGLGKLGRQLDNDDDVFVLVWDCGGNRFWLIGWLFGDELRARPDRVYDAGYKYVKPPYRPMPLLLDHISHNRVVRTRTRPSAPSAAERLWD